MKEELKQTVSEDSVTTETNPKGKGRNRGRSKGKMRNNGDSQKFKRTIIGENQDRNDVSWYNNIKPMTYNVANLAFNQVTGLPFQVGRNSVTGDNNKVEVTKGLMVAPGIMVLPYTPVIGGNSKSPVSPINIASQQIYALDRKANSGAKNYDKTDLMLVIQAMDSAYIVYNEMVRAYRIISDYDTLSRYKPNTVLRALGWDPTFLEGNLSNFRDLIDLYAYKLSSINVPDQFDFIKRHSWMSSNLYLDNEGRRSQMYAFKARHVYKWVEGKNDEPTHLELMNLWTFQNPVNSISELQQILDEIISPILGSSDIGTISGDLEKAFGANGMIQVSAIERFSTLTPVYNGEVLSQIENALILNGRPLETTSGPLITNWNINVKYDDLVNGPYLRQNLQWQFTSMIGGNSYFVPLLNMHTEDPSPDDIMVATRLTAQCSKNPSRIQISGTDVFFAELDVVGTEFISNAYIVSFGDFSVIPYDAYEQVGAIPHTLFFGSEYDISANSLSQTVNRMTLISLLESFRCRPATYTYFADEDGFVDVKHLTIIHRLQDLDVSVPLDPTETKRIHEAAVMSLYAVKDWSNNILV